MIVGQDERWFDAVHRCRCEDESGDICNASRVQDIGHDNGIADRAADTCRPKGII